MVVGGNPAECGADRRDPAIVITGENSGKLRDPLCTVASLYARSCDPSPEQSKMGYSWQR
jgi:hypothetical protein